VLLIVVSVRSARFSLWYCLMRAFFVQRRRHVLRHDSGTQARRLAAARDPALEDELHLLRAAEIEVLADHLFEEQPAVGRAIEHLGQ
jgi:hypothetical protein